MATNLNEGLTQDMHGQKIYYKDWDCPSPKAVILLFHGIGEYCGRYDHVARFFNEKNIAFRGFDWPGHGKSAGKRGHAKSLEHLMDVAKRMADRARADFPDVPLIIYGHSMGGNLALTYLLRFPNEASAGILSEPWIRLAFEPNPMMVLAGKIAGRLLPGFTQPTGLNTAHISRDPAVVSAYEQDSQVHAKVSAALGLTLLNTASWLNNYSGEVPMPFLLMHSKEDQITSWEGTRDFADRVSGPAALKLWDDLYHELHNEPEQKTVLGFVYDWMKANLGSIS